MCADGKLLTQLAIGKDLNGGGGRLLDQSGSYELLRGDLCETLLLRQEREVTQADNIVLAAIGRVEAHLRQTALQRILTTLEAKLLRVA